MKKSAKLLSSLAAISALALVISGCSSTTPDGNDGSVPPALPATAWVRANAGDVADGGKITLPVGQFPATFNINQFDGAEVNTNNIVAPTTGGPFKVSENGESVIDTNYASSAEIVSDSPQVVEVKLNPDAVFEDGTPITVATYQSQWKAMNGSNEAFIPAVTNGWKDISSIEQGSDEYDMKITFSSVFPDWQMVLGAGLLPESISGTPEAFNEANRTTAVPSSGPFRISKIDVTGQVITLERNPAWWGETPKLENIYFRVVTSQQAGASFANKEIDAVDISADADLYSIAKQRSDAKIQSSNGLTYTHVTFNAASGPLADVNVRKAIASGINRETIAAAANTPVGVEAVTAGNYIFMPGQSGYVDGAYPYDLEAATGYLEAAGYTLEGTSWVKDGEPLKLSVTVPADVASNMQRSELIQADLAELNIPVELKTVPANAYFAEYILVGDYDMATFSWQGTNFPIGSTESLFYPVDAGQNFTGVTDDSLGELWAAANSEMDKAKRIDIANEISETIWSYVPMVPIAPLPNVVGVTDGLVNWGAVQFETIDWTIVGWAK